MPSPRVAVVVGTDAAAATVEAEEEAVNNAAAEGEALNAEEATGSAGEAVISRAAARQVRSSAVARKAISDAAAMAAIVVDAHPLRPIAPIRAVVQRETFVATTAADRRATPSPACATRAATLNRELRSHASATNPEPPTARNVARTGPTLIRTSATETVVTAT